MGYSIDLGLEVRISKDEHIGMADLFRAVCRVKNDAIRLVTKVILGADYGLICCHDVTFRGMGFGFHIVLPQFDGAKCGTK